MPEILGLFLDLGYRQYVIKVKGDPIKLLSQLKYAHNLEQMGQPELDLQVEKANSQLA